MSTNRDAWGALLGFLREGKKLETNKSKRIILNGMITLLGAAAQGIKENYAEAILEDEKIDEHLLAVHSSLIPLIGFWKATYQLLGNSEEGVFERWSGEIALDQMIKVLNGVLTISKQTKED